ncbi:zinc finger-like domain-containing protein [Vitiosangium sp. GDMCC 1.1324]|uniref:zinc finger-like domain-containing protein n=1 Tax=Vitiosangium sp. (strain GDMCC 1.1324) TaxID=2138576 RepID=UPI000D3B1B1E|nr:zinc finger-like domain-containing protein [Vitiosangium sp. GDMCC 1.1324]PTL75436.1 hypothetical protein DAT35_54965 [Vitiosangium sp. GDMCC 1.1324]
MSEEGIEQRARAAAGRWARWRLGPSGFADLITKVEAEPLRYGRLITRYAVRTASWQEEPNAGRACTSGQPLVLESLDLWSASPEQLAERSSHLAPCGTCGGDGQVTCPTCSGTLRASCGGCGGTGKQMSRARKSFRLVNCRDCRGKGTKKCTRCTKGQVSCSKCRGSGAMRRWLRVVTAQRTHVGVWPEDKRLSAHPGLREDSRRAPLWGGAQALASVETEGPIPSSGVGAAAQAAGFPAARPSLEPALHPLRDRILTQVLDVFEAPSATVHFEFAGRRGFIKLLGSDCRPTADSDSTPLLRRAGILLAVAVASFLAAQVLLAAFLSRHPFYGAAPGSGGVALATFGLALGACLLTATRLRRRQVDGRTAPGRWHDRLGPSLSGVSALAYLGLFLLIQPSAAELSRLTAAGQLQEAELHAGALEARRETSSEYIEARNAFVTARARGMENRAAVELISHFVGSGAGTEPLEAERRRLREAWVASALAQEQESVVEQELEALRQEGAPEALVNGLRAELESRRVAKGKELLAKGRVEEAIHALTRITAPGLAAERPEPLLTQAYLAQAQGCPERNLHCRAEALKRAVGVDTAGAAQVALASFRTAELARLQKAARPSGNIGPALRALREAEADAGGLLTFFEGDAELTAARQALLARRQELIRDRLPFNEPVEVAETLLGSSGLEEQRPGVLKVLSAPAGTLAFLFVDKGMARGLYVTSTGHAREALSATALQQVAKSLTGQEFAAKDLVRSKPGVAHVQVRLGSHSALLGWQDGALVEASIGKVEP